MASSDTPGTTGDDFFDERPVPGIVTRDNDLYGVLRRRAAEVQYSGLAARIGDVLMAYAQQHDALGIAAPQVGIGLRIIAIDVHPRPFRESLTEQAQFVMINPVIESVAEPVDRDFEGCYSVPGTVFEQVPRYRTISVRYSDRDGAPQRLQCFGMIARVIQHEVDHLDGRLLGDYTAWEHAVPLAEFARHHPPQRP